MVKISDSETLSAQKALLLESRISKVEVQTQNIGDDIKDIKKTLRWLIGLVFSLNSTILVVITKGFGIVS
jgi:hypothetical protein